MNTKKKPPWKGSMCVNREVLRKGPRPIAVLVQRLSEHQKKSPHGRGLENLVKN